MKTAVVLLSKTFFPQHPKAGKLTYFAEKIDNNFRSLPVVISGETTNNKIHTCRSNFEYWKAKIDKLKSEGGGVLSVRQWREKPYRSPQETIIDIPAEIVGIQKLRMVLCNDKSFLISIDRKPFLTEFVCANDGLTLEDFKYWFLPVFEKEQADVLDFAIIHFTSFRY
jgi:hypothetical protein